MKICIVPHGYPNGLDVTGIFVLVLAKQMAQMGHHITIVAPQSLTKCAIRRLKISPYCEEVVNYDNGGYVKVYRPKYLSFGNLRWLCKLATIWRVNVIKRVIDRMPKQDAFYGHFWSNAYVLFLATRKHNVPLFVASGEDVVDFPCDDTILKKRLGEFKSRVNGVICVSTKNLNESVARGLVEKNKCRVFPNSFDANTFYRKDKMQCREQIGISKDRFVVAYLGQLSERKGAMRLSNALTKINDDSIDVMYIGEVVQEPHYKHIIHIGPTKHDKVNELLNCADIFVLPTRAEGCSNAVVEALAVGLPVVSSDLPFNHDILNKGNSILIDPDDVDGIAEAIKMLKDDVDFRRKLAEGASQMAQQLMIEKRAENIIKFIKEI